MKVFIGGIMQGSRRDSYIDDQDYRRLIAEAILAGSPRGWKSWIQTKSTPMG